MAERDMSDSDSDVDGPPPVRPPPKRRRIIDPSAVTTVPIYSNKVSSSLQLKSSVFIHTDSAGENADDPKLWTESQPSPPKKEESVITVLSDSEEDPEKDENPESFHSASPPPPPKSPPVTTPRRANRKIQEINRKLNAVGSLLSPSHDSGAGAEHHSAARGDGDDDDDDDIIVVSTPRSVPPASDQSREIPLKFRCRTDLYKIPVQSMAPLSTAVKQLSVKLNVPPARILLLRKETELPVDSTANELGLGIADIIDCVVIADEDKEKESDSDIITVRLQGKDKGSTQDYSLHKEAPLGSILSQYRAHMGVDSRRKVRFLFDGSKVTDSHTPSQLDMEDGDVIEVWA
ncbi:hypothetical protein MATL_G00215460 [Megalops atlanticus]|uniref:NFATC2-interacting protein n=1 Tax=Megalops atlanticus TaxID=7932 RepID=A0A9D3SXW3_MEGAT|nr:hypothetical protein MATL_G00215460 [Megalops atlanticus]